MQWAEGGRWKRTRDCANVYLGRPYQRSTEQTAHTNNWLSEMKVQTGAERKGREPLTASNRHKEMELQRAVETRRCNELRVQCCGVPMKPCDALCEAVLKLNEI